MANSTKQVRMVVVVRVPRSCTAAEARREVRTLVNEQCMYALDSDDIHAVSVKPATRKGARDL